MSALAGRPMRTRKLRRESDGRSFVTMVARVAAFACIATLAAIATAVGAESAAVASRRAILAPQRRAIAFRSMDTVFPYHVISRGSGPVFKLPRAERALDVTYVWKGKRHTLADLLTRTDTQGLLVIKDGKIVFERYFGGATDASKFTSWSVGKSFTSTLVGLALSDGKIESPDDPVTKYLPELKGSGYDGVPIKDILQMSSGVKFTEEYNDGTSDVNIMWNKTMVDESETIADYARSLDRAEKPGSKFVYRSIDTGVLGMLVKRATGNTLAHMLSDRIWKKLGMEHDASWLTDRPGPDSMEAGYCCINATLRDYGRFGLLFLNKGRWNGKQIVPTSWVDQATNPQSRQVQYGHLTPGYPIGYGYQWWLMPGGGNHPYSAEGVFFQFIYVDPAHKVVIVKTSAYSDFWNDELEGETLAAYRAIADALGPD
jgi:CubicO group peptidase (beta-lactamase class C family)